MGLSLAGGTRPPQQTGETCCGGSGGDGPAPAKVRQYDPAENPCEALRACAKSCRESVDALRAAAGDGDRLLGLAVEAIDSQRSARYAKDPRGRDALLVKFERQTQELQDGLSALEQKTRVAIGNHYQPGFEEKFAEYRMALRAQADRDSWDDGAKEELAGYERELRHLTDIHAQCAALALAQQRQIAECAANLAAAGDFASSALTLWAQAKGALRGRPTPLIADRSRNNANALGTLGRMEMKNSTSWGNLAGDNIDTSGFGAYGRPGSRAAAPYDDADFDRY